MSVLVNKDTKVICQAFPLAVNGLSCKLPIPSFAQ